MSKHTHEQPQDNSIKIIPLGQKLECIIDAADESRVVPHKWSPVRMRGNRIYAYTLIGGKIVYMHAFLTG